MSNMEKVNDFLKKHKGIKFTIKEIAEAMGFNPSTLKCIVSRNKTKYVRFSNILRRRRKGRYKPFEYWWKE